MCVRHVCCALVLWPLLAAYVDGASVSGDYVVPRPPRYDYAEALHKSFLFFRSQQSGAITRAGQQRLAWRSDSCLQCVGAYGEDLSGGFYEAANTMKWGLPNSWTTTQMAWNVIEFGAAMARVNELAEAKQLLRWAVDDLMACHPRANVFVGQLGSSAIDFKYYGPPEHYHTDALAPKPVLYVSDTKPASEIVCEAAAALAAAAIVFRDTDAPYADRCLSHARQLFQLGKTYPGTYMAFTDAPWLEAQQWYPNSAYTDEIGWAAIWLYKATGEAAYLVDAEAYYPDEAGWAYDWADKGPAMSVLLASATGAARYHKNAKAYFDARLPGTRTVPHTPKGLMYMQLWSSIAYASNTAFLAFAYRKRLAVTDAYRQRLLAYGASQVNYALGDAGQSFIGGFGLNPPRLPYHKSSYNSVLDWPLRHTPWEEQENDFLFSSTPNRHVLYGAVVGGPTDADLRYDNRNNYEYTEVAIDYNAGFSGALSALIEEFGGKPFSDCGLDLGWSHPGAPPRPTYPATDCYHTCCIAGGTAGGTAGSTAGGTSAGTTGVSGGSTSTRSSTGARGGSCSTGATVTATFTSTATAATGVGAGTGNGGVTGVGATGGSTGSGTDTDSGDSTAAISGDDCSSSSSSGADADAGVDAGAAESSGSAVSAAVIVVPAVLGGAALMAVAIACVRRHWRGRNPSAHAGAAAAAVNVKAVATDALASARPVPTAARISVPPIAVDHSGDDGDGAGAGLYLRSPPPRAAAEEP